MVISILKIVSSLQTELTRIVGEINLSLTVDLGAVYQAATIFIKQLVYPSTLGFLVLSELLLCADTRFIAQASSECLS